MHLQNDRHECKERQWNDTDRENQRTRKQTYQNATLTTTNSTGLTPVRTRATAADINLLQIQLS